MPEVAIAALLLYLGLVFGVRTWLHWRRTGRTGFVGLSGKPGSAEWLGGLLFAAALLATVGAPFVQLAGWLAPLPALDGAAARIAGLVLLGAGIAGTFWAQLTMGDSWRIGVDAEERTALVLRGPFRYVRNPIFSFMGLGTAGLVLLVPNALALIALLALFVALELQVRAVEEPYLAHIHGEVYLRYARATGRFFPGLGRLSRSVPRPG